MLEEYRSLPRFHQYSAIASTLLVPALILFLGSSVVVAASFVAQTELKPLIKKTFLLGFGSSIGLFMISCNELQTETLQTANKPILKPH